MHAAVAAVASFRPTRARAQHVLVRREDQRSSTSVRTHAAPASAADAVVGRGSAFRSMAEPLPVMPGAPTNLGNPFHGASSPSAVDPTAASSPSAGDPAVAPSSTSSAGVEAQPHIPLPSSPPNAVAVAAGDAAGSALAFQASPISFAAAEHAGASTTPTNAPKGAHATGAATPEDAAINDLLPDLDPNDPELTIEEQCDYAGETVASYPNAQMRKRTNAQTHTLRGSGVTWGGGGAHALADAATTVELFVHHFIFNNPSSLGTPGLDAPGTCFA